MASSQGIRRRVARSGVSRKIAVPLLPASRARSPELGRPPSRAPAGSCSPRCRAPPRLVEEELRVQTLAHQPALHVREGDDDRVDRAALDVAPCSSSRPSARKNPTHQPLDQASNDLVRGPEVLRPDRASHRDAIQPAAFAAATSTSESLTATASSAAIPTSSRHAGIRRAQASRARRPRPRRPLDASLNPALRHRLDLDPRRPRHDGHRHALGSREHGRSRLGADGRPVSGALAVEVDLRATTSRSRPKPLLDDLGSESPASRS